MGVVKNLMLRVGADFSAVTTQSKKASKSMGSMMSAINRSTSKLNSAISGMSKVLGAAGIAVSLAGVVSAAKNAAAAFNEVQENNAALAQVMKNTMGATREQWLSVLDWLKPALDWLWDNALGPATEHLGRVVADFQEGVGDIYRTVGDLFSGKGLDSSGLVNAIGKVIDFFSYGIFSSIADVLTMMGVMDDFNAFVNGTLQDIQSALNSALHWVENSIVNPLISAVRRVRDAVQEAIATVMQLIGVSSRFDASGGGGSGSWGKIGRNWKTLKISALHFAEGGVMQSAGLFVANENGVPEMVGRMGHHAAVANNGQIQDGIAQAVLSALLDTGMLDYVRSIADSSERTARKDFSLGRPGSEAGRWVSRSLEAYEAVRG